MTEDQKKVYVKWANNTMLALNENIIDLYWCVAWRLQDYIFHYLKNKIRQLYAENILYKLMSLNLSAAI